MSERDIGQIGQPVAFAVGHGIAEGVVVQAHAAVAAVTAVRGGDRAQRAQSALQHNLRGLGAFGATLSWILDQAERRLLAWKTRT